MYIVRTLKSIKDKKEDDKTNKPTNLKKVGFRTQT